MRRQKPRKINGKTFFLHFSPVARTRYAQADKQHFYTKRNDSERIFSPSSFTDALQKCATENLFA